MRGVVTGIAGARSGQAARSWWLAAVVALVTLLSVRSAHASPVVTSTWPTSGATVRGLTMQVGITVTTPYLLTAASAKLQGVTTSLMLGDGTTSPVGEVDIAMLARGAYTLELSVTDAEPSTTTVSVPIFVERAPKVTVTSPVASYVGPIVRYRATCADEYPGGCTSLALILRTHRPPNQEATQVLAAGTSSLDVVVDYRAFGDFFADAIIVASDPRGAAYEVTTGVGRWVRVHPPTCPIVTVSNRESIADFDQDRVVVTSAYGDDVPTIAVRSSTTGAILDGPYRTSALKAWLFPSAVLFTRPTPPRSYGIEVAEVRGGALASLGVVAGAESIAVGPTRALIATGVRDMVTGATLGSVASQGAGDVGPNGDVVYWGPDLHVHRWRTTGDVDLTPGFPRWAQLPRTDGVNVVFADRVANPTMASGISLIDGAGAIHTIVGLIPGVPGDQGDYRIAGGWLLYQHYVTSPPVIHLRSPAGVDVAVDPSPGDACSIEALAPTGVGVVRCAGAFFRIGTDGAATRIEGFGTAVLKPWSSETFFVAGSAISVANSGTGACPGDPTESDVQVIAQSGFDAGVDAGFDAGVEADGSTESGAGADDAGSLADGDVDAADADPLDAGQDSTPPDASVTPDDAGTGEPGDAGAFVDGGATASDGAVIAFDATTDATTGDAGEGREAGVASDGGSSGCGDGGSDEVGGDQGGCSTVGGAPSGDLGALLSLVACLGVARARRRMRDGAHGARWRAHR